MRAIDLYSGIGGWTLGLRLAGVEVADSFEWWGPANETHGKNFGKSLENTDIRTMPESRLPEPGSIQFVVGSPPCTQFSFSNRGGNGDLEDGLIDVRRMLETVAYLKPRYWMMENVPRVSQILKKELAPGGSLHEFAHLVTVNEVFNMSEFGLPQARSRMVAGNFPLHVLNSYKGKLKAPTLGDVIDALKGDEIVDPLYRYRLHRSELTDHLAEELLTPEETRMNGEAKSYHPVYNKMSFPDRLDRPARTVTATCTRVSRESIVVLDPELGGHRRLTLRERAVLQGFPVTYQFFGKSYSDRMKMIGNAVPPFFTYLLAMAMKEVPRELLRRPSESEYRHVCQAGPSKSLAPDPHPARYPAKRSFRFAVPGLRFGSGVRFELKNHFKEGGVAWRVDFYYGTSKSIRHADISSSKVDRTLREFLLEGLHQTASRALEPVLSMLRTCTSATIQERWTRQSSGNGPYELIDEIGHAVVKATKELEEHDSLAMVLCARAMFPGMNAQKSDADLIRMLVGAVVGAIVNDALEPSRQALESEAVESLERVAETEVLR